MRRLCLLIVMGLLLAACAPQEVSIAFEDLPPGEPNSGAKLFEQSINRAPRCADCHNIDQTRNLGPGLGGFAAVAGERVAGESAEEYTFNSIVRPSAYVVRGYSNVMYNQYAAQLTPQDIADLMAYILNLN